LRRIGGAKQHDIRVLAAGAFAFVDQIESGYGRVAVRICMWKHRFRRFSCVAPDMPARDDQILFEIGAAADKGLATSHRTNID
jgi:hypothetical protein